jgi:hypothetical protein
MRRAAVVVFVGMALVVGGTMAATAPGSESSSSAGPMGSKRDCGTRWVFGKPFGVRVLGHRVGCRRVRRLITRPCKISFDRTWSCFSFREDDPFIAWFLSDDLFKKDLRTLIVLNRYPCSRAKVSPSLFSHLSRGFPTRRQMLADDLIRCQLLKGMSRTEVEATIGPAEEPTSEGRRTYLDYSLGLERDSILQIDGEYLEVEIERDRVQTVGIYQG